MKKFRFLLTIGGTLVVMIALTAVMFNPNAGAVPLTNVSIGWSGSSYNGWYTVYTFQARLDVPGGNLLAPNPLAAFCVDPAHVYADASYELISADRSLLATKMADYYFNVLTEGSTYTLPDNSTRTYTQRDFQIANLAFTRYDSWSRYFVSHDTAQLGARRKKHLRRNRFWLAPLGPTGVPIQKYKVRSPWLTVQ